ncbi:PQQ-binding-like beta-propeller repeat protein [Cellulomonas sp. NPDC057328]|uniref:outer membrane protein assembly factor BamB family protein n=1 Tax=Cellulomonas sp. NPDC057328 TaxID=3346101 RepID=UPI003628876D
MGRAARRTDVELVEDDDADGRAPADEPRPARAAADDGANGPSFGSPHDVTTGAPDPRSSAWTARRRLWGAVAAGLALVAVAVGAQTVVDARERAEDARLASVPGVIAPVPPEIEVLWSATGDELPYAVTWPWSDAVVGLRTAATQGRDVVALDPATGATRWRVPLVDPPDEDAADVRAVGSLCVAADDPPAPPSALPARIACLASDVWQVRRADDWVRSTPTTSRVVVLATADGEVVADVPTDTVAGTFADAVGVLDGVAVVAGSPAGGGTEAWGLDLATGAELWRVPVSAGARDPYPWWRAQVVVADGVAAVVGQRDVVVVEADGAVRRTVPRAGGDPEVGAGFDVRGGLRLTDGSSTTFVRPDGDLELDGAAVWTTVDDGSAPGLLLMTDGDLRAHDAATGERRWDVAAAETSTAVVLDGRVHAATREGLVTLDAATGEVLWRRDGEGSGRSVGAPVTDGRVLHVAREGRGGGRELVALDPADGHEVGSVPLPEGVRGVQSVGGLLVGWDDDRLSVLGARAG